MSIRAFDRAQDAYNLAKKQAVQTKVIVFVIPKPKVGTTGQEIRFPYSGEIIEVYASSVTPGIEATIAQVEKCNQSDYDTTPVWRPVLSNPLTLDENEKSTTTSSSPSSIADSEVDVNDHFRINFSGVGTGLNSLTLEIVVAI